MTIARTILSALLIVSQFTFAGSADENQSVAIILNQSSVSHADFHKAIEKRLEVESNTDTLNIDRIDLRNFNKTAIDNNVLVVTVGTDAFREVLDADVSNPIWAVLIPEQSYYSLVSAYNKQNTKAWFINQPLHRRIALLKAVLPEVTKYGLLVEQFYQYQLDYIAEQFSQSGLTLNIKKITSNESPIKASQELFDQIDALFTVVSPNILNRNTAKGILLSSYRKKIPVIAYSNAYVKAGALAAVYSEPGQLAQHLAEDLLAHLNNSAIETVQHPKYYSVAFNNNVARSLSIKPKPLEEIYESINQNKND